MSNPLPAAAPRLLRLGHLMAFTGFLRKVGAPVDRYLRREKLPVLCNDPDTFVPLAKAWSFFHRLSNHEDSMIGWFAGAHVGDHNLNGTLMSKLLAEPTLHKALQQFVRLAGSEASHIQLGIHERRQDILFYTHYSGCRAVPGYMVAQAYQLQVILGLIRQFLGRRWVPDEVGIEHLIAPDTVQAGFPGSRILTGQTVGYIAVPRTCLGSAAIKQGSMVDPLLEPFLTTNFGFKETLRALLRSYLPDGYPSAQFSAELMDVSERTLARRLAACGLTYGALIDEVRFEEAKRQLREPTARIGDVAMALGFTDQGNFTRMFRRVGGLTPREYRSATLH